MAYADLVNRFSATRVGGWLARQTAARLDPWVYRRTGGRFTSTGPPTIPQITLITTGRKTGKRREVQLAALADGDDFVVVASNFGQEHHPAWMYNLQAEPRAQVRAGKDLLDVTAQVVTGPEKEELWPRLHEIVPQFDVYRDRTDRDIQIFRLRRDRP
jgi:deazaflavin-dependent oxidoreductase (nitroreductase family)